ncbi:XRE family transcriptional regulator [Pseudomonas fluorescens]|uniref:XRE family transcriptional regulator n=1 Tax=Pseudomonas TaxID=286 RepID=UPI0010C0DA41|nr:MULTISPECIES: XRE family transcriptional regulator [Pseudomonas]MBD8148178.1 XRE family transcriptional regulator [Pseudomonas fluorescens]MBD8178215.1 XRE family transcriptional regulator [Pseudomonas fluorescens]MBD8557809.1 XRE family transcriptional regulator [Pseudomonas fluorescens]MBD8747490.1 XRE family transcriptional regulator [Pseudomonas fluorescens]MBD8753239.1 XRE family transcriptional regulator [Pseudomonas fluorescens]
MGLRTAFAGVLRALRLVRRARYADISDATHRRKVSALENAQTSITLDQFVELAESLGISPVTMLALSIAQKDGRSPLEVLHCAIGDSSKFQDEGGMKALGEQFDAAGELVKRTRGKPLNLDNEKAVLKLQADGLTQRQVAEKLGIALSSVREYWPK